MRIERDIDRTVSFRSSQGTVFRGTLSKLSRRNIVFEIYNPFSPVQTSEVLSDLKVRRGKNLVYQGDAVVTGIVTTSILVVVSATLVNQWSAVDAIISDPAGLGSEVGRFVDEWDRANKLQPNYQLKVADLRSFLSDLSFWLDQVDLAIEGEPGASHARLFGRPGTQVRDFAKSCAHCPERLRRPSGRSHAAFRHPSMRSRVLMFCPLEPFELPFWSEIE